MSSSIVNTSEGKRRRDKGVVVGGTLVILELTRRRPLLLPALEQWLNQLFTGLSFYTLWIVKLSNV